MGPLVDEDASAALRAALERRCAQGVTAAAAELVGGEPDGVCRAYAAWHAQARRPWPWLAGLCFDALEQLEVNFPQEDENRIVAGRALIAIERDPERVRAVLRSWTAEPEGTPPLVPEGGDISTQLRRRSLVSAVDQFWEQLRNIAAQLHPVVLSRDRNQADVIVRAGRRRLEQSADHVRVLAGRVHDEPAIQGDLTAELALVPAAPPLAQVSVVPPPRPSAQPAPSRRSPARAARPSGQPRAWSSPEGPRPSSGEHRLAPILFLGAVTIGALIWILSIGAGALSTP